MLERIVIGAVAVTTRAFSESALEITFQQWRVMVVVGESAEGATVSQVASRIGAAISPASKLVTRLKRRGLLVTSKDPADRRVTRARLTPAGIEMRDRVLEVRRVHIRRIADSLGPDTDEAAAFGRLADALVPYL